MDYTVTGRKSDCGLQPAIQVLTSTNTSCQEVMKWSLIREEPVTKNLCTKPMSHPSCVSDKGLKTSCIQSDHKRMV